jgi:glycosyltransferase involved in cell wall biosynthesis
MPENTVVVTGKVEDGSWLKSPLKCIPFTDSPSRYNPKIEKEVLDFLDQHRVTHILCEYGCAGTEIVILNQQLLHLPLFVHFHGYDVSQELRKPKTVKYYEWMGDNVAGIITDTRIQKKRLVEIGVTEGKIHIIPYGVKIPAMQTGSKVSPCRFICVSRLVPKKGPIYMLKAFSKARKINPAITLDIVGDGPLMAKVQSFITKDNLRSSVRIHGAQSNEYVKNLLYESSVYVQHSLTDRVSGDAEGLPVAILEAAAAGLPVVSTLHEGIPDEVEHGVTGFLVKEFDVDTMAMHMAHLAGNNELRRSMGIAARIKIQKSFTLENEINSLRTLMGLSGSCTDSGELQRD